MTVRRSSGLGIEDYRSNFRTILLRTWPCFSRESYGVAETRLIGLGASRTEQPHVQTDVVIFMRSNARTTIVLSSNGQGGNDRPTICDQATLLA